LNSTEKPKNKFSGVEGHHILPKSLFPEYKKERWNIVYMSAKDHFVAHYLLLKCVNNRTMTFAFNQMKRVIVNSDNDDDIGVLSCLFAEYREKISLAISEANSGLKRSQDICEAHSIRTKNTVIVRIEDGSTMRVSCDHPKYIDGTWVFYRTGIKHKQSTIDKIALASSKRGNPYHNKSGDVRYFTSHTENSEWSPGHPKNSNLGKKSLGLKFWSNTITNEQVRSRICPGENWINKRTYFGPNGNPNLKRTATISASLTCP
jgi:hypothetical protein